MRKAWFDKSWNDERADGANVHYRANRQYDLAEDVFERALAVGPGRRRGGSRRGTIGRRGFHIAERSRTNDGLRCRSTEDADRRR